MSNVTDLSRDVTTMPFEVSVVRALALVPLLLGALVLLGWTLDVDALRYLSPLADQPRIKANTALCIVAIAVALVLRTPRSASPRRREHFLGLEAGIDQLLVHEQPGAARTPHLGRMAANTAAALLLLAVALLLFEARWRGRRPATLLIRTTNWVCDHTGVGIPADRMPMLFEPFERLGAESGGSEGTGLGLALCQRLVGLMGGSIEVAGEQDGGTTFTVVLALADPLAAATETSTPNTSVRHTLDERDLHVVYIEDNVANLRLVETALAAHGVTVRHASSVAEGMVLVAHAHPDVVLVDMHLPDGTGLEVLKRLKSQRQTAAIPVIVLTADATNASRRCAHEHGAQDFLAKPLDVELLLDALGRVPSVTGPDVHAANAHQLEYPPQIGAA